MPSAQGISISIGEFEEAPIREYVVRGVIGEHINRPVCNTLNINSSKYTSQASAFAGPHFGEYVAHDQNVVTVYVPTCPVGRFCLQYKAVGFCERSSLYFLKIFLDGEHVGSWGCGAEDGYEGKVMFGVVDSRGERSGKDLIDRRSLEIQVFRARKRVLVDKDLKPVLGWSTVGLASPGCQCRVELAETGYAPYDTYYKYSLIDPKDSPFVTFRYVYQKWEELVKRGVVLLPNHSSTPSSVSSDLSLHTTNGSFSSQGSKPTDDILDGKLPNESLVFASIALEYCKRIIELNDDGNDNSNRPAKNDTLPTVSENWFRLSATGNNVKSLKAWPIRLITPSSPPAKPSPSFISTGPSPIQNTYDEELPVTSSPGYVYEQNSPLSENTTYNEDQNPPTVVVTPAADERAHSSFETAVDSPKSPIDYYEALLEGGTIHPDVARISRAPTKAEIKQRRIYKATAQKMKRIMHGAGKFLPYPSSNIAGSVEIRCDSLPFRAYQDEHIVELVHKSNMLKNGTVAITHSRNSSDETKQSNDSHNTNNNTTLTSALSSNDDAASSPSNKKVVIVNNFLDDLANFTVATLSDEAYVRVRAGMAAQLRMDASTQLAVKFCQAAYSASSLSGASSPAVGRVGASTPSPRSEIAKGMMEVLARRFEKLNLAEE